MVYPIFNRIAPVLLAAAAAVFSGKVSAAGEVSLIRASSTLAKDTATAGDPAADTNTVQSAYFLILIKNIAYSKSVTLWVRNDTAWDTLPCAWSRQADDDNEYWDLAKNFTLKYGLTDPVRDLVFKIEYVEGVHTYWDDNGGLNYSLSRNGGSLLKGVNVLLRNAKWAVDTGLGADTSIFSGQAEVRGYRPGNTLKVSLTPDNLKTQDIREAVGTPVPTWTGTSPMAEADRVWLYDFSFAGIKLPYEKNPSLHFHLIYSDSVHAWQDDNRSHQYALGLGMKLENLVYEELPVPAALRYPANARVPRNAARGYLRMRPSPVFSAGARGLVDGIGRSR
ncbi:MAG: endonuclease/exonuclease/phosphatase [Fibrobacteres bacterium]|nr:endonuclease/exonuclease/phosphatase [Fibrobacterota bacterium]